MNGLGDFAADLVGRFDPDNPVNLTLFFAWLVLFVFTFAGVWRAQQRWVRLLCYVVNQGSSFVMLQAGILTLVIVYGRWREAAATAALTLAVSIWLFRERKRDSANTAPSVTTESPSGGMAVQQRETGGAGARRAKPRRLARLAHAMHRRSQA